MTGVVHRHRASRWRFQAAFFTQIEFAAIALVGWSRRCSASPTCSRPSARGKRCVRTSSPHSYSSIFYSRDMRLIRSESRQFVRRTLPVLARVLGGREPAHAFAPVTRDAARARLRHYYRASRGAMP
jgi:hypothetical protein